MPSNELPGRVIARGQNGPISYEIRCREKEMALFKTKERNTAVRDSLKDMSEHWLNVWMMKRFNKLYAEGQLHYHVTPKWQGYKNAVAQVIMPPFVGLTPSGGGKPYPTGRKSKAPDQQKLIIQVQEKSHVFRVGSTQHNWTVIFRVPFGHPVPKDISAMFATIPKGEILDLSKVLAAALDKRLKGQEVTPVPATVPRKTDVTIPRLTDISAPRRGDVKRFARSHPHA